MTSIARTSQAEAHTPEVTRLPRPLAVLHRAPARLVEGGVVLHLPAVIDPVRIQVETEHALLRPLGRRVVIRFDAEVRAAAPELRMRLVAPFITVRSQVGAASAGTVHDQQCGQAARGRSGRAGQVARDRCPPGALPLASGLLA